MLASLPNPTGLTWTWFNQAGSVITVPVSGDAMNLHVPNSGSNNISGQTTPASGTYTFLLGLRPNLSPGNFSQVGLVLTDGTNYIIIRCNNNNGALDIWQWIGIGTPSTNLVISGAPQTFVLSSGILFLRVTEASGTRSYAYSFDGLNFYTFYTEATGTFLVTSAVGFFGLGNGWDAAGTILAASVT
jgi:hypothetical protein